MPTTMQSPARTPPATGESHQRRLVAWLWILAIIAVLATAVAIGYGTGLIGEEATSELPFVDDVPVDEPVDEAPAAVPTEDPAEAPADEPVAAEPDTEPPAVRYDEELRANWDVTGVADDDMLNVRDAPGVVGAIVATLAHDAAELESTGRIAHVGEQLWREVVVPGDGVGWVSAAYLTETT